MLRIAGVILFVFASCACGANSRTERSGQSGFDLDSAVGHLPAGWRLTAVARLDAKQVQDLGARLNAAIRTVEKHRFKVFDEDLEAILLVCASARDAQNSHARILRGKPKGDDLPDYVLCSGAEVLEFSVKNSHWRAVQRAGFVLGKKPAVARYRVVFEIALIAELDYMIGNELSRRLTQCRRDPASEAGRVRLEELLPKVRAGDRLSLRACGQGETRNRYTLATQPVGSTLSADGSVVTYRFGADVPTLAGLPYVGVEAIVESCGHCVVPGKASQADLASTPFWPSGDWDIAELARRITRDKRSPIEKAHALLDWLVVEKNLTPGGDVRGSRYGVRSLLAKPKSERKGYCWDFADMYVTLCRAAGVPARQVGGWRGRNGHLWVEVYLDGLGWLHLDPTRGTSCGPEYIPYFVTNSGEMPLEYVSYPTVGELK